MPRRDGLRRRRPFRDPLPRILIVCEGTRTEPGYFNELRHTEKIPIELVISPGGVPKTLVERAVELKNSAKKDAKFRQDENLLFDEVWCVFDIDEHPAVPDAKQQTRDNEIDLAISNPCFELWILLHFRDQRAHIDRAVVQRECVKYLPDYEKKVPFGMQHPTYREAVQRALALDTWQQSRGRGGSNPWTAVHKLTEKIKSFGRSKT
jgi:RloB-like protein